MQFRHCQIKYSVLAIKQLSLKKFELFSAFEWSGVYAVRSDICWKGGHIRCESLPCVHHLQNILSNCIFHNFNSIRPKFKNIYDSIHQKYWKHFSKRLTVFSKSLIVSINSASQKVTGCPRIHHPRSLNFKISNHWYYSKLRSLQHLLIPLWSNWTLILSAWAWVWFMTIRVDKLAFNL